MNICEVSLAVCIHMQSMRLSLNIERAHWSNKYSTTITLPNQGMIREEFKG